MPKDYPRPPYASVHPRKQYPPFEYPRKQYPPFEYPRNMTRSEKIDLNNKEFYKIRRGVVLEIIVQS
jgi:hypothetical protein